MEKTGLDDEYWQMMPKYLLGFRKTINNCLEFVTNEIITYSCGIYMLFNNISKNSKNCIPLERSENISSIFVFIEKKVIVLEERLLLENRSNLIFLDIQNATRIKSISIQNVYPIMNFKFSHDGSRFIIQNDAQWLTYWVYDKSRLICSVNIVDNKIKPNYCVKEISFYPRSKNRILAVGVYVFVSYSVIDDNFVIDWEILHTEVYLCHSWINSKEILLGNNIGQILIFNTETCNYESTYNLPSERYPEGLVVTEQARKVKKNHLINCQAIDDESFKNLPTVDGILSFSRGFICLVDKKKIYFYKKFDSLFNRTHLIELPVIKERENNLKLEYLTQKSNEQINKLILNRSETLLICLTSWSRLFKAELTNETENYYNISLILVESFHFDSILGLDISLSKPLFVSYGKDNIFNIWNYETGTLEFMKYYDEEIYCIAIHPTGLYVAIGFYEKIKLLTIYVDGIKCTKILNLSSCKHCAFSNGGQYFAATNLNTSIVIYTSLTYEEKITIKQKFGKIKHFLWSKNDNFIITCSTMGSVCVWDADNGEKINEFVSKTNNLGSLAMFQKQNELENVFVLDGRNEIKELEVPMKKNLPIKGEDLILKNQITTNDDSFASICCDIFGYMMLIGQSTGKIIVKPFKSNTSNEISGHNNEITLIRFTHDNNYVISCSIDGTIIVWHITSSFSFIEPTIRSEFNQVLIAKSDLQVKNFEQLLKNTQLEEENEIIDYELKLNEMSNNEKLNLIDYNCKLDLSSLRSILKELKIENENKAKEFELKFENLIRMFENDFNIIKENSEKELIEKFNEYDRLDKIYQSILKKGENVPQISDEVNDWDAENVYKDEIKGIHSKHKEEFTKLEYEIRLIKEENKQIEIEGDDEIESFKKLSENKIKFYKKDNEDLQLDVCFMRKKLINDEEKVQNLNGKREAFDEFLAYKQKKIMELENRIEKLKIQVDDSKKILISKDEKCFKLKHQNQRLEKMRFINEYEIVEFHKKIDPLRNENLRLTDSITELESKCNVIMLKANRIKKMNENYKKSLTSLNRTFVNIQNRFRDVKLIEKQLFNVINYLRKISDKDEKFVEMEFEKIMLKVPKVYNKINIDMNAVSEIDSQMLQINKMLKRQTKETKKFEQQSKETVLFNIKENLFIDKSLKKINLNLQHLELKFKSLLNALNLTKSKVNDLINLINEYD